MLMSMAQVVAKRGTCSRAQVGAVFARDGRVIVTGYNGAPAGMKHCDHGEPGGDSSLGNGRVSAGGGGAGCQIAEHAERNAIAFAARHGQALEGSELYCTHAPCLDCAKSIINAGVEIVRYIHPYRITAGVELLEQARIKVIAMSDPGLVI